MNDDFIKWIVTQTHLTQFGKQVPSLLNLEIKATNQFIGKFTVCFHYPLPVYVMSRSIELNDLQKITSLTACALWDF